MSTEIQALSSFPALGEYLKTFTPAMYAGITATAASIGNYIRHGKKYKEANKEFYNMMDNQPVDILESGIIDAQARVGRGR